MNLIQRSVHWGLNGHKAVAEQSPDPSWTLATVNTARLLRGARLNPWIMGFLLAAHGLGVSALFQPFHLRYLPIMVGVYLWLGLSVTLYLHRHLTHKGFEMAGFLKVLFALGAVAGLSGDPVGWVGDHRHHHRASDQENDVHSPRHLGFWMAHWGWIFRDVPEFSARTRELGKDVRAYWYGRLFERPTMMILPHLAIAVVFWATLGFGGMVWCWYVPITLMNHVTWCINSICHLPWLGYKNFHVDDDSVNVPLFGLFALGEGYHNNHHANGRRASHGLRWYEPDPTRAVIWLLSKVGLVWNVAW